MRYAQRGGYTPAEQQRRERLRLQAAERFARGDGINEIAHDLRVMPGSVRWWHRARRDGGPEALRSRGLVSREKLSPQQWARLEHELARGPLAHGFANDQRWTLGRIKTLIGRLFHVGYTPEGVWKLMRRHGWSCQVPVRQALERDEEAVAVWKAEVWPEIKGWHATWAPTSASRTRQARPRHSGRPVMPPAPASRAPCARPPTSPGSASYLASNACGSIDPLGYRAV